MTRGQFEAFINAAQTKLYVRWPWRVVPCVCGDTNCHGWRFIEVPRGDLETYSYGFPRRC